MAPLLAASCGPVERQTAALSLLQSPRSPRRLASAGATRQAVGMLRAGSTPSTTGVALAARRQLYSMLMLNKMTRI